jgi:A/G-specific adenine glycosylase
LGYYRRARQLHDTANLVIQNHGGRLPADYDQLRALPGIGRYTAGAILSIAYELPYPILEANTIRLFARLLLMESDPRSSTNQKLLWQFSEAILPTTRAGDFNQALMELGSEICRASSPRCNRCPLRRLCPTARLGRQDEIPAAGRKVNYETSREDLIIVRRGGRYLIRQCAEGERWAGLWDFPRVSAHRDDDQNQNTNQNGSGENRASVLAQQLRRMSGLDVQLRNAHRQLLHSVTRFRITLRCWVADRVRGSLKLNSHNLHWAESSQLAKLPMSATGRKIVNLISSTGLFE